jgi:hypothetical protein
MNKKFKPYFFLRASRERRRVFALLQQQEGRQQGARASEGSSVPRLYAAA